MKIKQSGNESYILNFNYTHIIQKCYLSRYKNDLIKDMDYIHGEANINNTIKTENIVLGIGEYLPDDEKDKKTDFIAFKKFYQRIYKGTGSKYKEWLEQIQKKYFSALQNETNFMDMMKAAYSRKEQDDMWLWYMAAQNNNQSKNEIHNLYIFGHSLDVTDGDILRDLILNDNVHTTIFYYNRDVMGQQIANLVKVIGQDELIRRTGGSTKTIVFEPQKPMVPIEKQ